MTNADGGIFRPAFGGTLPTPRTVIASAAKQSHELLLKII